jgi:heptaprenyl diphosphate synthase
LVAELGPAAVRIQAKTFERLCQGQLQETIGAQPGVDPVKFYLGVLKNKTASLTATAARFGAMFAGASVPVQRAVAAYGELLGVAFQLADDVLDLTSETSGKTPGTDLREHVPTMPVLLLQQKVASGMASSMERRLAKALAGDLSDDAVLAKQLARLQASDVISETRALAQGWADAAIMELAPIPDVPARTALARLAHSVINRSV